MTLAPAVATIREMQRLQLVDRAKQIGAYLGGRLMSPKNAHPSVGDVRGLGLFWAVDLVRNRHRKEPFNSMKDKVSGRPTVVDGVAAEMLKRGVAIQSWISHLVIAPPLIITPEEIDYATSVLDDALNIADQLTEP
jgi:taurine--2-oxoglutarate transaminase